MWRSAYAGQIVFSRFEWRRRVGRIVAKENKKADFLYALVPIRPFIPTLISGMNSAEGAGAELS